MISMGYGKKDVTPVRKQWSYVFLALTLLYGWVMLYKFLEYNFNNFKFHHWEITEKANTVYFCSKYIIQPIELILPLLELTCCGQVMLYGIGDLGQHWFRKWLVSRRHHTITWTNGDLSSVRSSEITWRQFHMKYLSHQSLKVAWK